MSKTFSAHIECIKTRFVEPDGWNDDSGIITYWSEEDHESFEDLESSIRSILEHEQDFIMDGFELRYIGDEVGTPGRFSAQISQADPEREEPAIIDVDVMVKVVTTEPYEPKG
jgi:hypothetical protein